MMAEIEKAQEASVQSRARGETPPGIAFLFNLTGANNLIPPWWSRSRDGELRRFWREVDYLAGAVYTIEARIKTVPFRVEALDQGVKAHVRQAEEFQRMLEEDSEFGAGWGSWASKWVEDLVTQDNGTFSEVLGDGEPDGPIEGRPLGIAHLDAARCMRTSDPEFPVVYQDGSGKRWKMHFTRVMLTSQQTSPAEEMHGVGFCAVSRCANISQSLLDQIIYKQEKLGSRPQRSVWVTQGGLEPKDVKNAFRLAEEAMDNQLLRRYAKTVVIGSDDIPEAGIQDLDLASLPDGFDEQTSVTLGMSTISLAFGVDPRELFPGLQAGATRAEALIAHIKQRGKGPGDILEELERQINQKVMPPTLTFIFDFQDDEQDRSRAEIRKTRGDYQIALGSLGFLNERTIREQMEADGDITRAQFEAMELRSGRLPDGSPVVSIFADPEFAELADLGVDDPLDTDANAAADMLALIKVQRRMLQPMIATANPARKKEIQIVLAALDRLERLYAGTTAEVMMEETPERLARTAEEEDEEATEEDTGMAPAFGAGDMELKSSSNGNRITRYLEKREQRKAIEAAAEAVKVAVNAMPNGQPPEGDEE